MYFCEELGDKYPVLTSLADLRKVAPNGPYHSPPFPPSLTPQTSKPRGYPFLTTLEVAGPCTSGSFFHCIFDPPGHETSCSWLRRRFRPYFVTLCYQIVGFSLDFEHFWVPERAFFAQNDVPGFKSQPNKRTSIFFGSAQSLVSKFALQPWHFGSQGARNPRPHFTLVAPRLQVQSL